MRHIPVCCLSCQSDQVTKFRRCSRLRLPQGSSCVPPSSAGSSRRRARQGLSAMVERARGAECGGRQGTAGQIRARTPQRIRAVEKAVSFSYTRGQRMALFQQTIGQR